MTRLEIYSDPICPWCLIGKTRLMTALAAHGGTPFEMIWKPFRLNPDMPREGVERRAYLDAKFGARAEEIYGTIAATAQADGLDLHLDAITRTPDTTDAHRVIRWAQAEDLGTLVVDELFDRYFRRGEDISEPRILADAAATAGMERDVVSRLLAGDADRAEVVADDAEARRIGVTAVPTFVLGGHYVVQGAQPQEVWRDIITQLEAAVTAN